MTNETKSEIIKSFAFGMTIEEMTEIYDMTAEELKKILTENAGQVEEVKKYYTEG